MDAAAADPKIDIANSKKPANSLLNPRFPRIYSSANHISPTIAARTRAWPICLPGKLPRTLLEVLFDPPPPGANMPSTGGLTQAGNAHWVPSGRRKILHKSNCLAARIDPSPKVSVFAGAEPRQALVNGVSMPSRGFIKYLRLRPIMMLNFQNGSKPWNSRAPIPRSSDRSSSGTC